MLCKEAISPICGAMLFPWTQLEKTQLQFSVAFPEITLFKRKECKPFQSAEGFYCCILYRVSWFQGFGT